MSNVNVVEAVRQKYSALAKTVNTSGCCDSSACCGGPGDPVSSTDHPTPGEPSPGERRRVRPRPVVPPAA